MKRKKIENIYPEDLRDFSSRHKEKDYLLLDVRLPEEYVREHIPGSRLIPLHELEGRLGELGPGQKLIFYCSSGKRSMAAATLARDSGLFPDEIFNLEGGINAYTGKTLHEFPKLEIFHDLHSTKDVLEQAIALEKGAQRLYSVFMHRLKDHDLKRQMQILADLEVSHAQVLYKQGKDLFARDFESMFEAAPDRLIEGGLDADAWFAGLESAGEGDMCTFFLELALEMENMAYDMYRNLAEKDFSRDLTECFFVLSEQEKAHMRLIARIFKDCSRL